MTSRPVTSTTALIVGLSLILPTPTLAQSSDALQSALEVDLPTCVNKKGTPWSDIIDRRGYTRIDAAQPELPDQIEAAEDILKQAQADPKTCVIRIDGDVVFASGKPNGDGTTLLRKPDMEAAALQAGFDMKDVKKKKAKADDKKDDKKAEKKADKKKANKKKADKKKADKKNKAAKDQTAAQSLTETLQQAEQGGNNTDSENTTAAETLNQLVDNLGADATAQTAPEPEVAQEDTQSSTEIANQLIETLAASDDSDVDEGETVETRVITQEDTRSSDQDFANAVSAQAAEKDGLSDFEKLALGAAGAAVIGTLLANGNRVVANSGDRVVVQREDGEYEVLKDDNVLLRQPGVEVKTKRFDDGSSREVLIRENGVKIVTIRAADGQTLRRVRVMPDGERIVLFDDTQDVEPVNLDELPEVSQSRSFSFDSTDADELRAALAAAEMSEIDRRFTLRQIRNIRAVRELVPVIELEAVTFDTGSAAIRPTEAEELRNLGVAMQRLIADNPYEVFLVEGHTDAIGGATFNLALSDRRAESVALALSEYFDVPPENMVVQGYGESNLKIRTLEEERENRRATVRRITPLLQAQAQ